ncbi:P-type ATPase, partial [Mycolicibacterium psychrotolerans]
MISRLGRLAAGAASAPAGMLTAAREMLGGRPSRRCWRRDNRSWIEVRGLTADTDQTLGTALIAAVRAEPGVRSVQLNYPLSRVVVAVDPNGPSLSALCAVVTDVEDRVGAAGHQVIELPGDGVELGGRLLATAATGAGMCVAGVGRILLWPKLPTGVTAVVTAVDYQPLLRDAVARRLGENATDTAVALASAAVYTLTQAPASLAVEVARHLAQVGELTAAAQAWQRHEPTLAERAEQRVVATAPTRPCPMPPGPVERHAQRSGTAQGIAAPAVGLLTGNLNTAATSALVMAPKAARNAREAFAATLGRGLAHRHDALALRPRALRRLDRIDAVVIDPRVLLTDELKVSRLRTDSVRHHDEMWQWAQAQLLAGAIGAGWHRVPPLGNGNGNGHSDTEVYVGHAHHPLAAAVIGEIRRGDIEVVSLAGDELGDLRPSFDELLPADGAVDSALRDAVVKLQTDGRTVAVLSSTAEEALLAADLAIGLTPHAGAPPWHADMIVGDLAAAWRIVHALPAARHASRRGVELATSATLLGALLMIPGGRGLGPGPVTAGAAAGLLTGLWLARAALRDPVPTAAPVREWHAMTADQVRELLPRPERAAVQRRSLLAATAGTSAAVVGGVAAPPIRLLAEFATAVRDELSDPLTPVLAVGSAASALLGSPIDAILVGSVLTGNAVLAASQQVRAERLLRRLLAREVPPARRVAGDGYDSVDAAALLPGDLIEVRSGEVIPADCRLISCADLEVDESALTGESLPTAKQVAMTPGATVAERRCMLYATTTVVA